MATSCKCMRRDQTATRRRIWRSQCLKYVYVFLIERYAAFRAENVVPGALVLQNQLVPAPRQRTGRGDQRTCAYVRSEVATWMGSHIRRGDRCENRGATEQEWWKIFVSIFTAQFASYDRCSFTGTVWKSTTRSRSASE